MKVAPYIRHDDLQDETAASLLELESMERSWSASLNLAPLPEFETALDMESRKHDRVRLIKYLHQACRMHCDHLRQANAVKLSYLMSGFRAVADARNTYGLYFFSRAALELLALLHEVLQRLTDIAGRGDEHFAVKGQEFFGILIRARYGTRNPELVDRLRASGVPARSLKPLLVSECMKGLAASEAYGALARQYDELCDFVHHNAPSHAAGAAGVVKAHGVLHSSGGGILAPSPGLFTVYEYPVTNKERDALATMAPMFKSVVIGIADTLRQLRFGPFSEEFLVRETGNRLGLPVIHNPERPLSIPDLTLGRQPRYNDLCPCGSGKIYKRCCLNKRHIGM